MKAVCVGITALLYFSGICFAQTQIVTANAKEALIQAEVVVSQTYTAEEEERDNRRVRFGQRELQLSDQLDNDKLKMTNDGLEDQIARLEGRPPNPIQITLDRFVIDQDKAAIEIANKFSQIWFGTGDKRTMGQMLDVEQEFDAAVHECIPENGITAETLDDLKSSCADLRRIYIKVSLYQSKTKTVPSMFKETIEGEPTMAQKLLKTDTMQLERDTASVRSKEIKAELIQGDKMLVKLDKMLRLAEMTQDSVIKHNNAHPDKPMADVMEIISKEVGIRQQFANINNEYRQKVANFN